MIARLLENPHRFDLFQAISLLEREASARAMRGDGRAVGDGEGEPVRLIGHVALGFQPSDIQSVKACDAVADGAMRRRPGPAYVLCTPAMTLAGGQGPLPQPYTELLLARLAERDGAMRDFLDIFNHRFIGFLFRGRKKRAPGLNWESLDASPLAACVRSMVHLADEDRDGMPWLRHAGLMTAAPRSMIGLLRLLADRFGVAVRGKQFVGEWLALESRDRMRLGGGATLDGRRALGHRVWNQAAAIELSFDGVDRAQLRDFLPTGRLYASLSYAIRRYLQCPMDVFLVLRPAPDVPRATRVGGDGTARLGWTTWLQRRSRDGDGDGDGDGGRGTRDGVAQVSRHASPVRMRLPQTAN